MLKRWNEELTRNLAPISPYGFILTQVPFKTRPRGLKQRKHRVVDRVSKGDRGIITQANCHYGDSKLFFGFAILALSLMRRRRSPRQLL